MHKSTQVLWFYNSGPEKSNNETESWKIFVIVSTWDFEIFYPVIWKVAQPLKNNFVDCFHGTFFSQWNFLVFAHFQKYWLRRKTLDLEVWIFDETLNMGLLYSHYCIHIFWDNIWCCVKWTWYCRSFILRRFDKRLGHLSRNTCLTRS